MNDFQKFPRFSENKIKNRRTKIFSLIKRPDACFYYRILNPHKHLARQFGWEVKYQHIDPLEHETANGIPPTQTLRDLLLCHEENLHWADIIVMQRPTCHSHLELMRYIQRELKKPVTVECFTYNTPIFTSDGFKRIGEIVDSKYKGLILAADGRFYRPRTFFKKKYDGIIYKIRPWYISEEIECTGNHKWPIIRGDLKDGIVELKEAENIRVGDFFKIPFITIENSFREEFDLFEFVKNKKFWKPEGEFLVGKQRRTNKVKRYVSCDNDLSRLFGYFLSEGNVNYFNGKGVNVTFSFNKNETLLHQDVRDIVFRKFGIETKEYPNYENSTVRIYVNSSVVADFFTFIFGEVNARTKKVPDFYFDPTISHELIGNLFIGLFRGDGCDIKRCKFFRGARLTTSSKAMALQIHNLLFRFGIISSIYKMHRSEKIGEIRGKEFFSNAGWELKIGVIDGVESLVSHKGDCNYKTKNKNLKGFINSEERYAAIEIRSITREQYSGDVYNICLPPTMTYNVNCFATKNCDDNYLDVSITNGGYKYFSTRSDYIRSMIFESDLLTVTTQGLADVYWPTRKGKEIAICPNSIDIEELESMPNVMDSYELQDNRKYFVVMKQMYPRSSEYVEEMKNSIRSDLIAKKIECTDDIVKSYLMSNSEIRFQVSYEKYLKKIEGKTVLYWTGSPTHKLDLDQVTLALKEVMKDERCHLAMGGFINSDWFNLIDRERMWLMGLVPVKYYYSYLKQIKGDISFCPVQKNLFNKGKCIAGDSLIVSNGKIFRMNQMNKKRIDDSIDAVNGDVVTRFGSRKFEGVYFSKKQKTLKIKTNSGYEIEGTPTHKILNSRGEWIALQDISIGEDIDIQDLSFVELSQEFVSVNFPLFMYKFYDNDFLDTYSEMAPRVVIDDRWGRFLGYLVGGGYISGKSTVAVSCSVDYPDIIEDVTNLFKSIGVNYAVIPKTDKRKIDSNGTKITGKGRDIKTTSKTLRRFLEFIGLSNKKGREFGVPDIIFKSPKSVIRQFLMGLFESDGTIQNNSASVSLTSKCHTLVKDVQFLLLLFGIKSSISIMKKTCQTFNGRKRTYYKLSLNSKSGRIFAEKIGFISKKKTDRLVERCRKKESNGYDDWSWAEKVKTIVESSADVFDICVPDCHEYIANGIISHNSNLKAIESFAIGVYTIVSDFDTYDGIGDNAPKCSTPDEWKKAFYEAINDVDMRREVVLKNKKFVQENYDIKKNCEIWKKAYEQFI